MNSDQYFSAVHFSTNKSSQYQVENYPNFKNLLFSYRGTLPARQSRKTYQCSLCNKTFTSGNNMEEHIKVKHENHTPEACDECNRSFGTPHALKTHKYNMHRRTKCDVCGQSLCNTFWLKRHLSSAHGITPQGSHQCSHCPLFFSSKGAKDNHVKKQHAELFKI